MHSREAKAEMSDRLAQRRIRQAQPKQTPRPMLPGEIRRVRIGRPANDNKSGLALQVISILSAVLLLAAAGVMAVHFVA